VRHLELLRPVTESGHALRERTSLGKGTLERRRLA
jgi:hypothetical protein